MLDKINLLKSAIEKGKTERTRAETNLETYENQLKKVDEEIKALDVDPENVSTVVAELDKQIENDLAEARKLIPSQYLGVM